MEKKDYLKEVSLGYEFNIKNFTCGLSYDIFISGTSYKNSILEDISVDSLTFLYKDGDFRIEFVLSVESFLNNNNNNYVRIVGFTKSQILLDRGNKTVFNTDFFKDKIDNIVIVENRDGERSCGFLYKVAEDYIDIWLYDRERLYASDFIKDKEIYKIINKDEED